MSATYRNSSGRLNEMLMLCPPPIDRPAIARSSTFFETLYVRSTSGMTSSTMSLVTGESPPWPSPPIIELMISASVAPAIDFATGSGTCFAGPAQKL